jgi:hypothetical protein
MSFILKSIHKIRKWSTPSNVVYFKSDVMDNFDKLNLSYEIVTNDIICVHRLDFELVYGDYQKLIFQKYGVYDE